jgi:hypothetical protein
VVTPPPPLPAGTGLEPLPIPPATSSLPTPPTGDGFGPATHLPPVPSGR